MSGRFAALTALVCAACLAAGAEDAGIDSLFDDPQDDIAAAEAPDTSTDHAAAFGVTEKPVFTGNFDLIGGIAAGWTEFPTRGGLRTYWDATPLADSDATFYLEARPDPTFRLHGAFVTSIDPASGRYTWSPPVIQELFIDYTVADSVFIRAGNHTLAWGQGRLYTPGNLLADSAAGSALRVSFPTVLSGLSVVALARNGFFIDPANPSYREVAYAAMADAVFGTLRASFGARYRDAGPNPEGLRALGSLKKTVSGTDVFSDVVMGGLDGFSSVVVLAGFYREWDRLKLYGEYQYGTPESFADGHRVGLAVFVESFRGSIFDIGVKWLHSLDDRSGGAALAAKFQPAKYLSATVALPFVYGLPGRFDILDEDHVLTQRVGIIALLKLSTPF